jgi:hypothetical protein
MRKGQGSDDNPSNQTDPLIRTPLFNLASSNFNVNNGHFGNILCTTTPIALNKNNHIKDNSQFQKEETDDKTNKKNSSPKMIIKNIFINMKQLKAIAPLNAEEIAESNKRSDGSNQKMDFTQGSLISNSNSKRSEMSLYENSDGLNSSMIEAYDSMLDSYATPNYTPKDFVPNNQYLQYGLEYNLSTPNIHNLENTTHMYLPYKHKDNENYKMKLFKFLRKPQLKDTKTDTCKYIGYRKFSELYGKLII